MLDVLSSSGDAVSAEGGAVDALPALLKPVRLSDVGVAPSPLGEALFQWYGDTAAWRRESSAILVAESLPCWSAVGDVAQGQATSFSMLLHKLEQLGATDDKAPLNFEQERRALAHRDGLRVPLTGADRRRRSALSALAVGT